MPIKQKWKITIVLCFLVTGSILLFTPFHDEIEWEQRTIRYHEDLQQKIYFESIVFPSRSFSQKITIKIDSSKGNFSFLLFNGDDFWKWYELGIGEPILSISDLPFLDELIILNESYDKVFLVIPNLDPEITYYWKVQYEYFFYYTNYSLFLISIGIILSLIYLYQYISVKKFAEK
ncbi:MAG: hypothetical protein GF329_02460 [Candidatus Lokiarchaeota archaeon]|nr:hypothetical protein [Candidatus Lokiarchaeota archaeon]